MIAFRAVLSFVLVLAATSDPPSANVFESLVAAGVAARSSKDFVTATKTFEHLLEVAEERHDTLWQFRANFYLGLTKQDEATTNTEHAEQLREEAEAFYRKALALKGDSTATMANLAELAESAGDREEQIEWLERALAVDDARYPDLAASLAAVYEARGDVEKASRYYRAAAERRPDNVAYDEAATALLLDPRLETPRVAELADYLFGRLARHDVDRVIETVFTALRNPKLAEKDASLLYAVLAEALVQKDYNLQEFSGSTTMNQLEVLAGSPHVAAIADLKRLYFGELQQPFEAWRGERAEGSNHPGAAEAFRDLARSIGLRAFRDRDYPRAERYFMLVQSLGKTTDPAVLRDLAAVYVADRKYEKLDALVAANGQTLAKQLETAQWHEREDYERYFRFISEVYRSLKPTGTRRELMAGSASQSSMIHASQTASGDWSAFYGGSVPDLDTISTLAARYETQGDHGKACATRVTAAEAFNAAGASGDALELLAATKPQLCASDDRARFDLLLDRMVVLSPAPPLDAPAVEKLKWNLVVLSQRDDGESHGRAKDELDAMGIRVDLARNSFEVVTREGSRRFEFTLPNEKLVVKPR